MDALKKQNQKQIQLRLAALAGVYSISIPTVVNSSLHYNVLEQRVEKRCAHSGHTRQYKLVPPTIHLLPPHLITSNWVLAVIVLESERILESSLRITSGVESLIWLSIKMPKNMREGKYSISLNVSTRRCGVGLQSIYQGQVAWIWEIWGAVCVRV